MPPRMGRVRWSVALGGMKRVCSVGDEGVWWSGFDGEEEVGEVRCLPACRRRSDVRDAEVRRERRCRSVGSDVSVGRRSENAGQKMSAPLLDR